MLLSHAFIETAKRYGSKTAVVDGSLGLRFTYTRLLTGSLLFARRFAAWPGERVGVMLPNSAGAMLAVTGLVAAGKVPVMINFSTGAAANCAYAQETCGLARILTARKLLAAVDCPATEGMCMVEDLLGQVRSPEKVLARLRALLPASWIQRSLPAVEPDRDAVILFTSGSERAPKAVPLTHANLASNIQASVRALALESDDVMMSILPFFHVFGISVNLWLPLLTGMRAVTWASPLDYAHIPRLVREEKATVLAATPLFLKAYLEGAAPGDFESLRLVVAGADRLPDALRRTYKERHNIDLLEGYGTTETSPVISVNTPEANRPGSIGRPIPGVEVSIAHPETDAVQPAGETGRILVRGPLVMQGYLNAPEENAARLRDGWYDTGDMGRLDADGFLWHCGRLRRFVKVGGEMVSLARTEAALEAALPADTACCVVDVPDKRKGARIVAAVNRPVDRQAVLAAIGDTLPPFALPRRFVVLDDLPLTATRKVDFRAVAALVRERLG